MSAQIPNAYLIANGGQLDKLCLLCQPSSFIYCMREFPGVRSGPTTRSNAFDIMEDCSVNPPVILVTPGDGGSSGRHRGLPYIYTGTTCM